MEEPGGALERLNWRAIGQSGRPDAPQILEQLKTKDLVNQVGGEDSAARNFSGDVLQAAFYYDLIQQYSIDALRNNIFTENRTTLYRQWTKTENGKNGWLGTKLQYARNEMVAQSTVAAHSAPFPDGPVS